MAGFIENIARRAGDMLLSHFGHDEELLKQRSTQVCLICFGYSLAKVGLLGVSKGK